MSAIAERALMPDLFRVRPAPWRGPVLVPEPEPVAHGCALPPCAFCGAESASCPVTLWLCCWCVVGAYT